MCKSTEKQKRYRDRRLLNGERRINLWLPLDTLAGMKKIADHIGISNREMIVRLVDVTEEVMIREFCSAA